MTLYCSFCGKSQREVKQLVAGPTVSVCDQCVDMLHEMVEEKRGNPDPTTKRAREIKLEELRQLRADVARLHDSVARIEEKINAPPYWMVEET
jgi:ATP-dependent protease Clp ATPase subunit